MLNEQEVKNIVKNMKKPVIWDDSNHLILSYDTINQLNIIQDKMVFIPFLFTTSLLSHLVFVSRISNIDL